MRFVKMSDDVWKKDAYYPLDEEAFHTPSGSDSSRYRPVDTFVDNQLRSQEKYNYNLPRHHVGLSYFHKSFPVSTGTSIRAYASIKPKSIQRIPYIISYGTEEIDITLHLRAGIPLFEAEFDLERPHTIQGVILFEGDRFSPIFSNQIEVIEVDEAVPTGWHTYTLAFRDLSAWIPLIDGEEVRCTIFVYHESAYYFAAEPIQINIKEGWDEPVDAGKSYPDTERPLPYTYQFGTSATWTWNEPASSAPTVTNKHLYFIMDPLFSNADRQQSRPYTQPGFRGFPIWEIECHVPYDEDDITDFGAMITSNLTYQHGHGYRSNETYPDLRPVIVPMSYIQIKSLSIEERLTRWEG
jgi:hypothetical protein